MVGVKFKVVIEVEISYYTASKCNPQAQNINERKKPVFHYTPEGDL
jgi:hypothetical protein